MRPQDERAEACFRDFLATGQSEPLEQLIAMYRRPLARFIDHYIHDPMEAEAICLDAFVELALNGDRFHGQSSLKTYLFAIGRNLALRYRHKLRREFSVDPAWFSAIQDSHDTPNEQAERKRALFIALGQIKPKYAEVLFLRYFEDMDNAEIQATLNRTAKQVANLLHRAKAALRNQLEDNGFEHF